MNAPATWPNSSLSSSVLGQCAAGDFDERPFSAAAAAVDRPGDHALAGAAFAGDQHGGPRVGHAVDHVEHLQHPRVVADDVVHAEAPVELRREVVVFFDARCRCDKARSIAITQLVVDQRLGEVVERAGPNGFDRAVGVP